MALDTFLIESERSVCVCLCHEKETSVVDDETRMAPGIFQRYRRRVRSCVWSFVVVVGCEAYAYVPIYYTFVNISLFTFVLLMLVV